MADLDSEFTSLIDEVKGLFGGKQQSGAPTDQTAQKPGGNAIPSPGGYTAPIHGTWHNLGGFNPSAVRYDDKPGAKTGRGHMGVDMGAAAGTSVYSIGTGTVDTVTTDTMGGNIVGVKHPDGLWSYYAHLSTAKAQKGDKVDQNTVIGTVGNTGNAGKPGDPLHSQEGGRTWPHLHFGIKEHGQWSDPAKIFSIPAYEPEYAKNPGKYQKFWLSDQAKEEAQAFNMKQHVSNRRTAFSRDVDKLLKIAFTFSKAVKKL